MRYSEVSDFIVPDVVGAILGFPFTIGRSRS